MSLAETVLVLVYAGLLIVALLAADRIGKALGVAPEGRRKIVHVALGFAVLTLPLLFDRPLPVVILCALSVAILILARRHRQLGAALHDVGRNSLGDVYFAISVASLFLFQSEAVRAGEAAAAVAASPAVFFVVPIAIMTLADTAAALAGTEYGKRIFPVERGSKSLEGVVAFFFVSWLVSLILLLLMTEIPRDAVIALSGFLALVGASIEAESWGGLDNLFVPLGLHVILVALAPADTMTILAYAFAYAAAVSLAFVIAQARDVAQQPIRAAILLVTVVWMTFGAINALLLAAVVVVTMAANRLAPQVDRHADLQTVFALVAIGMFWLLVGNATGRGLIVYFSISIAIYSAAMAVIALRHTKVAAGLAVLAIAAVLATRLYFDEMPVDARYLHIGIGLAGIVAAAALCFVRPGLFARMRARKVSVLAVAFACLACALMVLQ